MKKYFYSVWRYFLLYLLGFIVFDVFNFLIGELNEYLSIFFPGLFRVHNPITSHEAYVLQNARIAFLAAAISILTLSIIAVKHDNLRYEFLISRTDGFYTVKEGLSIYKSSFLAADIVTSLFVPCSTVWLTLIKIPENAPKFLKISGGYLEDFLVIPHAFIGLCGFVGGIVLLLLVSLISRLPAALLGLLYWRGSWLSNTEH